jgi:hypothetical protein
MPGHKQGWKVACAQGLKSRWSLLTLKRCLLIRIKYLA